MHNHPFAFLEARLRSTSLSSSHLLCSIPVIVPATATAPRLRTKPAGLLLGHVRERRIERLTSCSKRHMEHLSRNIWWQPLERDREVHMVSHPLKSIDRDWPDTCFGNKNQTLEQIRLCHNNTIINLFQCHTLKLMMYSNKGTLR